MRRSGALFWALILILFGTLLLLQNLGLLDINTWKLIGPLFLILLGGGVLWSYFFRRSPAAEQVSVALEGASRASLRLRHGAGRIDLKAGSNPGELFSGTFHGGLDYRVRREDDEARVKMRVPAGGFPFWGWGPGGSYDWQINLNDSLPLTLDLRTGASEMNLDLSTLRLTELSLNTGASTADLTLPANAGLTRVGIKAGATTLNVRVPAGVAARIHATGGASSIDVNLSRFPRTGPVYQSPDYDTAQNKADITVEIGAGTIDIR